MVLLKNFWNATLSFYLSIYLPYKFFFWEATAFFEVHLGFSYAVLATPKSQTEEQK